MQELDATWESRPLEAHVCSTAFGNAFDGLGVPPFDEGMGPRNERVIAAIEEAAFTGKGDKPVVVALYRDYATKVNNALVYSGEGVEGEYEGERNWLGLYEGHGVYRYADGDVYEGEFKAGLQEGRGVFRYANGDVYEGEFKAGKREGRGVARFANGNVYDGEWKADNREGRGVWRWDDGDVDSGFYEQGAPVGEGVRWLADGQGAVRLRDGKGVEEISLEEARQTAERLGLPIPSPLPGAA